MGSAMPLADSVISGNLLPSPGLNFPAVLCLQKWGILSSGDFRKHGWVVGYCPGSNLPHSWLWAENPLPDAIPKPAHLRLISCLPWGLIGVAARAEFLHSN